MCTTVSKGDGVMAATKMITYLLVFLFVFSASTAGLCSDEGLIWKYKELNRDSHNVAVNHYNRGLYFETNNNLDGALEEYNLALYMEPDMYQARNNKGAALYDLERYEDAIVEFRRALQLEPEFAAAHYNLATTYFALSRFSDAAEEYKQVLTILPNFINAYYFLAQCYNQTGDFLGAVKALEEVVKQDTEHLFGHYYLASNLFALKKMERALHHYKRVLELDPQFLYAGEVGEMIQKIEAVSS